MLLPALFLGLSFGGYTMGFVLLLGLAWSLDRPGLAGVLGLLAASRVLWAWLPVLVSFLRALCGLALLRASLGLSRPWALLAWLGAAYLLVPPLPLPLLPSLLLPPLASRLPPRLWLRLLLRLPRPAFRLAQTFGLASEGSLYLLFPKARGQARARRGCSSRIPVPGRGRALGPLAKMAAVLGPLPKMAAILARLFRRSRAPPPPGPSRIPLLLPREQRKSSPRLKALTRPKALITRPRLKKALVWKP